MPAYLPCDDCGRDSGGAGLRERYMVHDELWRSVGPASFLCIGCLEARLGRQLNGWDFTGCPLNTSDWHERSERLTDRLRCFPLRDVARELRELVERQLRGCPPVVYVPARLERHLSDGQRAMFVGWLYQRAGRRVELVVTPEWDTDPRLVGVAQ